MITVDAELLKRVKRYGMFHDEEDDLICGLILSAQAYLTAAGITQADDPRYELALCGLVLHWHDNRAAVSDSTNPVELPLGLRTVIDQLKFEAY